MKITITKKKIMPSMMKVTTMNKNLKVKTRNKIKIMTKKMKIMTYNKQTI